jgi:CubicO group peptidase (beta-lactamase class C family)
MKRYEFARVTPESVGLSSKTIFDYITALDESTEMHGLMIMRHGKVCAEGWWSPYGPGIRHGLQSLTKTYAATAVGIAYTEGILGLDERIIDIFPAEAPQNPSVNLQKLTVHHVLSMGCGMDETPRPTYDWIRDFLAMPVNQSPGTTFMYNSMGSTLLGAIVSQKTGLGLHDYLKPRLFDKIGINAHNLAWMVMPDGLEVGGGGLAATTEDNLRLMKLYADDGIWAGDRILAADYVRKATINQNDSASESKNNPVARDNFLGYGYQLWMCSPPGVYRADGAMGQFAIVFPNHNMIIAINETAADAAGAQHTLDMTWEFLAKISPERQGIPENKADYDRLARRLKHLSIEHPGYSPVSPTAARVDGQIFKTEQGTFGFENSVAALFSGGPLSKGITEFSFHFSETACEISFNQDGQAYQALIATDGTRCQNWIPIVGLPMTRVYLSGLWLDESRFAVTARWIETCFERSIIFDFAEKSVRIRTMERNATFPRDIGQQDSDALAVRLS